MTSNAHEAMETLLLDSSNWQKCDWPCRSLLDQLKELQALVSSTHPTKAQAGTCLMVLFLAFGLVLFPINSSMPGEQKSSVTSYAPAIGELNVVIELGVEYRCLQGKQFTVTWSQLTVWIDEPGQLNVRLIIDHPIFNYDAKELQCTIKIKVEYQKSYELTN